MRIKSLLSILCFGLYVSFAQAAVVKDLYSAKLVVADQSSQSWDHALPQALEQVLIKLSGTPAITQNATVKQAMSKAKLWVKSYSYHEQWQGDQSQLWLRFDFDTTPINQLLQQAHQAKWSNDRPLTLVWLEKSDASTKPVLVDQQNSLSQLIQENADRRGIPIIWPKVEDDRSSHRIQKIENPAAWEWAFKEYGVKAVLVGQVNEQQQMQARWLLIASNDSKQWDTTATNIHELIATAFDEAANWMAQQQIVGNDPHAKIQKINLQVTDVQDLSDYAKISDYLSQLSLVRHVSLGGVNEEGMLFELQVAGTSEQLIKTLSNSTELVPDETEHSAQQNTLYYRWVQAVNVDQNNLAQSAMATDMEDSQ